jgi:hypothetical protein
MKILIDLHYTKFIFNEINKTHEFPKFYFVKKLYMFRAFPLPIIRSFLQEMHQCRIYSRKLLMMGKGNARNM